MRTVKEELQNGYHDDEFCVGAMMAAVELYGEAKDESALIAAFANAARARNTSVAEIVALVETAAEAGRFGEWVNARECLLSKSVGWGRALTELRRLTASLNGRPFNPEGSATVETERPHSIYFTRALLNYCCGNASEAATLRAMQIDDPAVLTIFAQQFSEAAQKAGMDEAELVKLQARLSQSEASASDT